MEIFDILIHLDKYLSQLIGSYGSFVYLILFFTIFAETGFVITPFLPGDSLLFVVGSFAGTNLLSIKVLYPSLLLASILGNTINYLIGLRFGRYILQNTKIIKADHITQTERFFAKYGSKAVLLSRFLPFFRTFVPFFAGVGKMDILMYIKYNIAGGFLWVTLFVGAGYLLGNIPFVKENFITFVYLIIVITVLPPIFKIVKR